MNILIENIKCISELLIEEFNLTVIVDNHSFEHRLLEENDIVFTITDVNIENIEKILNKLPNDVHWTYFTLHGIMWLFGKHLSHVRELQCAINNCNRMVLLNSGLIKTVSINRSALTLLSVGLLVESLKLWSKTKCYSNRLLYKRNLHVKSRHHKYKKLPIGSSYNNTII